MRSVVILGSTGSIGTQALDIAERNREMFRIVGLGASGREVSLIAAQAAAFDVDVVALTQVGSEVAFQEAFSAAVTALGKRMRTITVLVGAHAQAARAGHC